MSDERRSRAARAGLCALNILWPGLGLFRIGREAPAMVLGATPLVALVAGFIARVAAHGALSPATAMAGVAASVAGAIAVAAALTWRWSADAPPPGAWWSRWYGLAPLWLAALFATVIVPGPGGYFKLFYVPAQSMEPTLPKNARFIARMGPTTDLRRGELVLVRAPNGATYVTRIAALGGDRISVEAGVVILNGRAVPQRFLRSEPVELGGTARRLAERFPGEAREHHIYDTGIGPGDHFRELRVRPGHVFLLGDNRDHAADSRIPSEAMGLDQLPASAILGRIAVRFF